MRLLRLGFLTLCLSFLMTPLYADPTVVDVPVVVPVSFNVAEEIASCDDNEVNLESCYRLGVFTETEMTDDLVMEEVKFESD